MPTEADRSDVATGPGPPSIDRSHQKSGEALMLSPPQPQKQTALLTP